MTTWTRPQRSYAVLGAGALGLTAALRLAQRGHAVTVLEREPLPGGLAAGFEIEPGMWLEKFYHHLFRSDRHAIRLINESGLGDALEWRRPRTVSLRGGELHQLDSPLSLLRFRPLPPLDRIRMGVALAYLRTVASPDKLEGQTAAAWTRRAMGASAWEVVWGPLFRGKFGDAADEIAMPWFWARVHDRTAQLGYLRGGFQRLYARLAERVGQHGGSLRFGAEVVGIGSTDGGLQVRWRSIGGEEEQSGTFERVVSTLPTRLTCRLTPDLPDAYRERHDWGRAYAAHCLIVALDRPLTDAYWINVTDPGYPFMAVVEHTNYISPADYGGRHLLYLGNYRPMDDPILHHPKPEVLNAFLPHLSGLNPAFAEHWVTDSWMFMAPFAQPIVSAGYRDRIPPFETPIPGLYVANMFQVYPHDRGQNYSVELAERLMRTIETGDRP